jgi:hypothetical protein
MLATYELKPLKVAALNLFHPTASPLFPKSSFSILRHSLDGGREGWGVTKSKPRTMHRARLVYVTLTPLDLMV